MSKFILTNSLEKTAKSVSFSTKYGYHVSGECCQKHYAFSCYSKLSVDNQNFVDFGPDFVSVIGSVIYKDKVGYDSLYSIYKDFDGDINIIRNHVLGNGAFIIKKGDEITIFCEHLALYHVFYYFDGTDFVVSDELYDVCYLCKGLEVDYDNFIHSIMTFGIYGKETEIKNIYCLQDNEKLIINTLTGNAKVVEVGSEWRSLENLNYYETILQIGNILKTDALMLAKHYGVPAFSSTGGLDNRLNMAAFLAVGIKPDLFYGIGNSYVTNTFDGDLEINKLFQKQLNLNLNLISWKCSDPVDKDWEELEHLMGFHSSRYAGSKDFNESYINIKNKLLIFGCMGEIYRINENSYLEDIGFRNYTLDEYIDLCPIGFFRNPYQLLFKDKEKMHNHIKAELLPLCEKWGMNPQNLSAEDDFLLWMERMRISDSAILNQMNRHHYCIALNAQYPIVRLLSGIHPKNKCNGKFQIDLVNSLKPELMQIPLFSRCMYVKYDKKTRTMKRPLKYEVKSHISKMLRNRGYLYVIDIYKWIANKLGNGKKKEEFEFDKRFEKIISSIFEKHGLVEDRDFRTTFTNVVDRNIVRAAQLLTIYDHLNIRFSKTE